MDQARPTSPQSVIANHDKPKTMTTTQILHTAQRQIHERDQL